MDTMSAFGEVLTQLRENQPQGSYGIKFEKLMVNYFEPIPSSRISSRKSAGGAIGSLTAVSKTPASTWLPGAPMTTRGLPSSASSTSRIPIFRSVTSIPSLRHPDTRLLQTRAQNPSHSGSSSPRRSDGQRMLKRCWSTSSSRPTVSARQRLQNPLSTGM